MSRSGLDKSDVQPFYQWARANHPRLLQEAVHKQMHQHDMGGYKALAERWKSDTPPSLEALKAAGLPVRTHSHNSQSEVFIRGQWVTPKAAARAGLI
jgi:hypothetical protein